MIRSYTVSELEQITGCTRRTISDYIAKGVLDGPSHRGRGARYPQRDLDVLTVLPRIRTLMKKDYPSLKQVAAFLDQLSVRDINRLAARVSEAAFVSEMRRLRVRNSLMGLLPYVPPERIEMLLAGCTPGQIRGVDASHYQIGAIVDIESLLLEDSVAHRRDSSDFGRSRSVNRPNGHAKAGEIDVTEKSWGANSPGKAFTSVATDCDDTHRDLAAVDASEVNGSEIKDRLTEITARLDKLESSVTKA